MQVNVVLCLRSVFYATASELLDMNIFNRMRSCLTRICSGDLSYFGGPALDEIIAGLASTRTRRRRGWTDTALYTTSARGGRGWSQPELARRAKVSQPYVAQLEAGLRKNPTLLSCGVSRGRSTWRRGSC